LCNELFSRTLEDSVSISKPKIHESVLKRIQNNAHVYAPIGIPHDYEVVVTVPRPNSVDADFRIDPLPAALAPDAYELERDAQARVVAERSAVSPLVYIRALLYLLTLLATAFFVIFPLTGRSNPLYERENELKWVSDLIRTVANFLPGWASSWFVAYASHPKTFLALAVVLTALLLASSKTAASIADQMTALWKASLAHTQAAPAVAPTNTLSVKERVLLALRSGWRDYLGPALSAIAIVYLGVTLLNRWTFTALDEAGFVCTQSAESKDLKDIPLEGVLFSFDISNPCFATGYKVGRLDRYLVWTMPEKAELDGENKAYKAAHKLTNDRREVGTCSTPANGTLASGGVWADGRGYSTFRNDNGPTLGSISGSRSFTRYSWHSSGSAS
jgi:hypothetical protein